MNQAINKDQLLRHRILTSTASNYVGQLIALGIFFFLTPFIVHQLGAPAYGLWVLVGSLMAYGSLLDLGIWGALIKYVAEYRVRGEYQEANALIATAFRLYWGIGGLIFLLTLVIAPFFSRWFAVDAAQAETARTLVILMGLGTGLVLPMMAPMAILRGLQRYDVVNLIEVSGTIVTAVATVLVLLNGGGLVALVTVNILGTVAIFGPAAWMVQRLDPQLRVSLRGFQRPYLRRVLQYSWPLFVSETAVRLQTKTDEITIGIWFVVSAITPYALAKKLSDVPLILTKQLVKVFLPMASELSAQADRGRLRRLYLKGSHLTLLLSLPLCVTLSLLAQQLLTIWIGASFADAGILVVLLSGAGLLASIQWPAVAVLRGMNRHRPLAAIALTAGLLNLGLSIALVGIWQLAGVAWGTLIPALLEFLVVFVYALWTMEISMGEAMSQIFLPVLLPTTLMGVTMYGVQQLWVIDSLLSLVLIGSMGLFIYFLTYLITALSARERQGYLNLIQTSMQSVKLR